MPTLIILALILLLAGCVSSGNSAVLDQDRLARIVLDVSTKEDVQRVLGRPNGVTRQSGNRPGVPPVAGSPSSEVWTYSHLSVEVDGATFIPIVGLFAGGATSNLNTFTVSFDEGGIVRHIASTQNQARSEMGSDSAPASATDGPAPIKVRTSK